MATKKKAVNSSTVCGSNPECTACALHKTSMSGDKNVVCFWGEGSKTAQIMLIGEAPGKDELAEGKQFTGEVGKVLDKYLQIVGLNRADLYITSAVKCRPDYNKPIKNSEIKACAPYLDYEISQLKPKVIGLLGATAFERVLGVSGISKYRGKPMWSEQYQAWCVPTWHPSFIVRNGETLEESEQFRRDLSFMKKIAETGETGQLKTEYKVADKPELLEEFFSYLETSTLVAVDTETYGDIINGKITTVQFSNKPGSAWVLPFYRAEHYLEKDEETEETKKAVKIHDVWTPEQATEIWARLKKFLEDPTKSKGGQNIKYDYQFFKLHGIELKGVVFDTMLAHYLLDENAKGQHDLGTLALKYTDMGDYSHELYAIMGDDADSDVIKYKMIEAPYEALCKYACKDADATFRLICVLLPKLKQHGLLNLLRVLMIPLSFELAMMEMRGIAVDLDYYKNLSEKYRTLLTELELDLNSYPDVKWLERRQGKPVNFNSPDQMRVLFYDILKLPVTKMSGGKNKKKKNKDEMKPSTDKEVLEKLAEMHPIPGLIHKHRKLSKFLSTYIEPIPELAKVDGRLHTTYQQHITATGRLSSSNPNLQNIPKREPEMAKEIRMGIIATPGYKLIEADFGQIEFRLWANESKDPVMISDITNTKMDIHKNIASIGFKMRYEDVTPEIREKAKTIVYSVIYGKSEENLAKETGLSVEQVKAIFNAIFTRYAVGKAWMEKTVNRARTTGEVKNWVGRIRHLAEGFKSGIEAIQGEARRQAVNSPIQGGAHDIMTVATLRVANALRAGNYDAHLVLNIHDALIVEARADIADEVAFVQKTQMEREIPGIVVPLVVDVAMGERLGNSEKLAKDYFQKVGLIK